MSRDKELSRKNKYWIPRHAFRSMRDHCYLYPMWRKEYTEEVGLFSPREDGGSASGMGDPTAIQGIRLADLFGLITEVEEAVKISDPEISSYLLRYVTEEGTTFDMIKAQGLPCERAKFYKARRRFYWIMCKRHKLIK